MKKDNLLYLLTSVCFALSSCNNSKIDSDSTTENVNSESASVSESSSDSQSTSGEECYEAITDVNSLFETYQTSDDYNFIAKYRVDAIQARQYADGWETVYQFDGANIQLDYEGDSGSYYTDYFLYNEEKDEFIYYLDMQGGTYKYLDSSNDYYATYVSYIDYFELAGIDFENDMKVDKANHKVIPVDNKAMARVGQTIFGNNVNEYWHKVELTYDDGYITHIDAISIYREVTYYYSVTIQDHGFVELKAPKNVSEYKNPYEPYMKHCDINTTGVALTEKQKDALNIFTKETDMNYTILSKWTYVYNNKVYDEYSYDFNLECVDGNYHYSYVDTSYGLTYNYYYLSLGEGKYPVVFEDDDFDNNYASYVSSMYIDRVLFYGINPDDFFYNEEGGYIYPKTAALEDEYVTKLFYYSSTYGGLRIYLKEDGDNLLLDKIETSMYISSDDSITSYIKTYTFTNIGSTTIDYPEDVKIGL